MPPALAIAGAAAATAGGAILSAKSQKKAAKTAAQATTQNSAASNALAREIYGKNEAGLAPFRNIGLTAGSALATKLGAGPFDGGNITSQYLASMDPGSFDQWKANSGFDFNMERGLKGIGIQAGSGGWLQSGAAIKGAIDFGNNLQAREWGNYRNALGAYGTYGDAFAANERAYDTDQYNTYLAGLSSLYGSGLSAQNALAGVGTNYVGQVTANNNTAATAAANAALAKGAAQGNMYAGIGSALGQAAGYAYNPYGYGGTQPWGVDIYAGGM